MGTKELLIILIVVLVVFGAKKLRSVGEDLGHAVRGFKKAAMNEDEQEESAAVSPLRRIRSETSSPEVPDTKVAPKAEAATERGSNA